MTSKIPLRWAIAASAALLPVSGQAALRLGLGSAVAHRSAELIDQASSQNRSPSATTLVCGPHTTGKTGTIEFTAAPIDLPVVTFLEPLGNLNPPGHTHPTDHIYFYYVNLNFATNVNPIPTHSNQCSSGCAVYAVADGYLNEIMFGADSGGVANQYKITLVHTDTFSSYYDHLTSLTPQILAQTGPVTPFGNTCVWVPVHAGEQIGTVGGVSGQNAMDLGVINLQVGQPFITPGHYGSSANSDSPLRYYAEPLRTTLYDMVGRQAPDYLGSTEKDGLFCYDVPNTVSGNWAARGSDVDWQNPDSWNQQLSIGYDANYASQIRITFGGKYGSQVFGPLGYWMVQPGALAPASVTAATGAYGYQIYGWDPAFGTINLGPGPIGLLMLQLIDNNTLKMEYFVNTSSTTTSLPFDSDAVLYTR